MFVFGGRMKKNANKLGDYLRDVTHKHLLTEPPSWDHWEYVMKLHAVDGSDHVLVSINDDNKNDQFIKDVIENNMWYTTYSSYQDIYFSREMDCRFGTNYFSFHWGY